MQNIATEWKQWWKTNSDLQQNRSLLVNKTRKTISGRTWGCLCSLAYYVFLKIEVRAGREEPGKKDDAKGIPPKKRKSNRRGKSHTHASGIWLLLSGFRHWIPCSLFLEGIFAAFSLASVCFSFLPSSSLPFLSFSFTHYSSMYCKASLMHIPLLAFVFSLYWIQQRCTSLTHSFSSLSLVHLDVRSIDRETQLCMRSVWEGEEGKERSSAAPENLYVLVSLCSLYVCVVFASYSCCESEVCGVRCMNRASLFPLHLLFTSPSSRTSIF